MSVIKLSSYDNSWYKPGRSKLVQALWFLVGSPFVRSSLNPSSGLRVIILKAFGAQIGKGARMKPGLRVKYPWRLRMGCYCWVGEDVWLDNLCDITLKDNICISQGAYLCTGNHDWSDPAFSLIVRPIAVGDGAWIGAQSLIGPGVEIGDCAVAAAGSVISKNIPAFEIHAGNPATFVRQRKLGIGAGVERLTRPTGV